MDRQRGQLQHELCLPTESLGRLNTVLLDPHSRMVNDFLDVVLKYGAPQEINRQAEQASRLPNLLDCVERVRLPWLVWQGV